MTSEIGMFAQIRDFLGFNARREAKNQLIQAWRKDQDALSERERANIAAIAKDKERELREALDQNPDFTRARNTQLQGFPIEFTKDNQRYTFTEGGNEEAGTRYTTVHAVTYNDRGNIEGTAFLHIRTSQTTGQIHFGENNSNPLNGVSALPKINQIISRLSSRPAGSQ